MYPEVFLKSLSAKSLMTIDGFHPGWNTLYRPEVWIPILADLIASSIHYEDPQIPQPKLKTFRGLTSCMCLFRLSHLSA